MRRLCLDSSVIVKLLVDEEGSKQARELIGDAVLANALVVAPAFAWAEVGSVLRKKVRQGRLLPDEAERAWRLFIGLPIEYVDSLEIRERAWAIASDCNLPTLYDAAFLAAAETLLDGPGEFWTSDNGLVTALQDKKPYVRGLYGQTDPH